jgi:DNA-binding NarL/FixJ family response regulator
MAHRSSLTALEIEDGRTRVLLVHEHALVRAGLRMLIESDGSFAVVAEAQDHAEAATQADQIQPDVILLNHAIDCDNGLEQIQELLDASRHSKVLVLTSRMDTEFSELVLYSGAMGLIYKDEAPRLLLKAIQKVRDGEAWVDRVTMGRVLTAMSRNGMAKRAKDRLMPEQIASLTKRERDVIHLVAQGLRNKQIAHRLSISDVTVRHHLTSTFNKLGVNDRFELMIYAYKYGLSEVPTVTPSPIKSHDPRL